MHGFVLLVLIVVRVGAVGVPELGAKHAHNVYEHDKIWEYEEYLRRHV